MDDIRPYLQLTYIISKMRKIGDSWLGTDDVINGLNSEIFRHQLGWDVCVTVLKRSLIPTIHKHNLPGCATMPWTLLRRSYRAHPANQFYVVGLWDFAWCFSDSVWDFNIHKTFLVLQGLGRQWVQLHFTDARLKLSRRESGLAPRQWLMRGWWNFT